MDNLQTADSYETQFSHDYRPPGPPSDPWGPYIRRASSRFDVPDLWIREVMQAESGGHEYMHGQLTVSDAGAMGLMQLEPGTYQEMAAQYGLGSDPFSPYDNIMAGTAYIHEMYEIYGSPGFLAAYDAGPGRLNSFMNGEESLPYETVNYIAMIAPNIQGAYPNHRSDADQLALNTMPMGSAGGILPAGFSPDAPATDTPDTVEVADNDTADEAYGGDGAQVAAQAEPIAAPAPPLPPPPPAPAVQEAAALVPPPEADSAVYVPEPAQAAPAPPPPAPVPHPSFSLIPAAEADTLPPETQNLAIEPGHVGWAIQLGSFPSQSRANAALGIAELSAVQILINGHPMVETYHAAGHLRYHARFVGLPHDDAVNACARLAGGPTNCTILSPDAQF